MRKTLLFSAAALMMGMAANLQAETAYGLMSGWPSWSVCSYDFDQLGTSKATKMFEVPFSDVRSAATVGDCYYVYGVVSDMQAYTDNVKFAAVNMETGETVFVNDLGQADGMDDVAIRDLAFDGTTLYGLKDHNVWDDATDQMVYGSQLMKVDLATGSSEVVADLDAQCWGLTSKDGELYVVKKSGMKGWSYLVDLCKVNADYSLTQVTNNEEVTCYESLPSHAATAPDGQIYYFAGNTAILMAAEGVVSKGDVTSYQSYTGTTFTLSTKTAEAGEGGNTDDEQPATRVLTTISSFGDFMGIARDDQLTAQKLYFYNQNLQVVAVVETAAGLHSTLLEAQYYNPYIYDENGNLVKKDRYQYGLYDFGDRTMQQAAGVVEYCYDALGNCIQEIEGANITSYEYDADGNCVKETHLVNGAVGKTIEYSNFVGSNKPATIVASHTNETFTGEFYEETREYDAEGRLVKAVRVCNRDYEENHGFWSITTAAGDFMQEEHWTYEGKQLALYEKFVSMDEETGELQPYLKTVYTVKDENTVGYQSYTAFGDEWYKSGVYQEETYTDFAGMTEATTIELIGVSKAEIGVNDAAVEFTLPMIAMFNTNVAFDIYRNGELVGTAGLQDVLAGENPNATFSPETGTMTYFDRDVRSGAYDYFVQVMMVSGGESDGVEPLDEEDDTDVDPEFNVEPLTYTGYCVSNVVAADLTLELPAATNVNITKNEKDENNYNKVTIGFQMPTAIENLGFICNELLVGNAQVGEDKSKDPEVCVLHCTLADDTATVSVLTRYAYGNVQSEKVTIDVNNIPVIDSIEQLLEMNNAEMMVFDVNGRQVTAPVESLRGNYIVVNGKNVYKVVLK